MKHEKEINELLRELWFDETWMDEEDYQEVLSLTFKETGLTKQRLSDEIEVGISNGYSVEQQIKIIKDLLNVC